PPAPPLACNQAMCCVAFALDSQAARPPLPPLAKGGSMRGGEVRVGRVPKDHASGGGKNLVVGRGIFVEKAYFVRETGHFSRARRQVFPVFVIWKHSLKLGLSKSPFGGLMVVGDLGLGTGDLQTAD